MNLLPQSGQRYFWTPSALFPSLTKPTDPQRGQDEMRCEFIIDASSGVSLLCFSEYHSEMVESTIASAAESSRPSGFGNDFKEPAQFGSFLFFMFGGLFVPEAD